MRNTSEKLESKALDYVDRVNRAIDFVVQNLDRPLPLADVARAAGFSPFHFHRIFRSIVGESLNEFVKRVRLEHAVKLLSHDRRSQRPGRSLTEVALALLGESVIELKRPVGRFFVFLVAVCFRLSKQVVGQIECFPVRQLHVWHTPRRPDGMWVFEKIDETVEIVLLFQRAERVPPSGRRQSSRSDPQQCRRGTLSQVPARGGAVC